MPKWEHCVITGLRPDSTLTTEFKTTYPKLINFTAGGAQLKSDFKKRPTGVNESDMAAITIALLGTDSWELISYVTGSVLAQWA